MAAHVQEGRRTDPLAPLRPRAYGPAGYDAAAHDRRARRFLLGVALAQLAYLAFPAYALVEHVNGPGRVIPAAVVLAFSIALYVWVAWRACLRGASRSTWIAAVVLTALGVALPLAYGPYLLGLPLYAAVLLGLALPFVRGVLAVLALAGVTAATGLALPASPFVPIAMLTALVGVVVLAASRLLTTTRELIVARGEIERLAAREERLRLARDLHDAVKQQVFVAAMEVGAARALLSRDAPAADAHLAEADAAIREAQRELAGVIDELRPSALSDRALADALRDHATAWSRRHGIALDLRITDHRQVAPDVGDGLFRAAQEALANAARHSGARRVRVELAGDEETITLTVADDGRGFASYGTASEHDSGCDPGQGPGHGRGHGLAGMRERMAALGGSVTVTSEPGAGTRLACACPRSGEGGR